MLAVPAAALFFARNQNMRESIWVTTLAIFLLGGATLGPSGAPAILRPPGWTAAGNIAAMRRLDSALARFYLPRTVPSAASPPLSPLACTHRLACTHHVAPDHSLTGVHAEPWCDSGVGGCSESRRRHVGIPWGGPRHAELLRVSKGWIFVAAKGCRGSICMLHL